MARLPPHLTPRAAAGSPAPSAGALGEVFRAFLRLGLTSFGGPVAHLGYFREEFVARRRWLSDAAYAELLALCQFVPGPASSQLGIAIGLHRAGALGGLLAWLGFTLPSAVLLVGLAAMGTALPSTQAVRGALLGLLAVAVVVVAHAVWGMARSLAPDSQRRVIALVGMVLALLAPGALGQVLAIACGAAAGLLWLRDRGTSRAAEREDTRSAEAAPVLPAERTSWAPTPIPGIWAVTLLCGLLVLLPLAALIWPSIWLGIADAFTRAGALVFGGGHVVLPLLGAEPVVAAGVDPEQFMAGYAAAQAVPGPLFTFAAGLGFELGTNAGLGWGALGAAALAMVAVFLPGVLWLLAALSVWERLRASTRAQAALRGTNAAVVGILAAALVTPVVPAGLTGWVSLGIALLAIILLLWRRPAWQVVLAGATVGALLAAAGLPLGW